MVTTGVVTVTGLATTVTIYGFDAANDGLVINGLAGDDVIEVGPWCGQHPVYRGWQGPR